MMKTFRSLQGGDLSGSQGIIGPCLRCCLSMGVAVGGVQASCWPCRDDLGLKVQDLGEASRLSSIAAIGHSSSAEVWRRVPLRSVRRTATCMLEGWQACCPAEVASCCTQS